MRWAKWGLIGFATFLFTLIWLADSGHGQWLFKLACSVPGGDKTGHFLLFGWLSLLLNLVWRAQTVRLGRVVLLKGTLIVVVFAIAEEISQLFFTSRTFDLRDLGAGLVGIWLFGRLAFHYLKGEPVLARQPAKTFHRKR